MSTGGPDYPMLDVDGDMHRLTPRLRWRLSQGPQGPSGGHLGYFEERGPSKLLEQAWQNVRTGALVWRPVEVEP